MACHAARQGDGELGGSNISLLPWLCCPNMIVIITSFQASDGNNLQQVQQARLTLFPFIRDKSSILESQECTRDQFLDQRKRGPILGALD